MDKFSINFKSNGPTVELEKWISLRIITPVDYCVVFRIVSFSSSVVLVAFGQNRVYIILGFALQNGDESQQFAGKCCKTFSPKKLFGSNVT